ncbi:glycosyltransferase family 2 protein [Halogeometricum borinquense]|uniref:glycosyltransferase family 2 protein n=1 Tax=Halogeometricum borinquense TaxID=60847 RepID=UPI003444F3D2
MNNPQVVTIILNWNNYEDTKRCIKSLSNQNYTNHEIVVVDNGSIDGSGERIDDEFDIRTYFTNENLGFAKGINTGVKVAKEFNPEFYWVVNNDVECTSEETLQTLVSAFHENPDFGAISPVIKDGDGDIWYEAGEINWDTGTVNHTSIEREGNYYKENSYLPLCAALIDADLLNEIGGVPEKYFLYYEDVDFCQRVKQKDRPLVTSFSTSVEHRTSSSSGGPLGEIPTYYQARNYLLFLEEYGGKVDGYKRHYVSLNVKKLAIRIANYQISSCLALVRGIFDGYMKKSGRGPYP